MPAKIIKTNQNTMWDIMAKEEYNSEIAMQEIMAKNKHELDTLVFSGNTEISLPETEKIKTKSKAPWE